MDILEHSYDSLCDTLKSRFGRGAADARAILRQVHRQGNIRFREDPDLARNPAVARRYEREIALTLPDLQERQQEGETTKLLFRLADGQVIESVLVPMAHYTTVCVSSQVGCRMGCAFCQTGKMGLVRQLTTAEIVAQVYWAKRVAKVAVRNVVFMGMGEPLDNFANLARALSVLSDQRGLDIAPRHITISTVGLGDGIARLADLHQPLLNLAVSIGAPTDRLRSRLMPVNQATPLDALQAILAAYPLHPKGALLISYVLIPDLNDTERCADKLAQFVAPLRAKINLIPLNPCPDTPYQAPAAHQVERFRALLVDRNVFVRRRTPKGQAIMAACGQLGARTTLRPSQVRV
jgi:23S rRNA (adenine2503-C2)-methyltransferase